MSVFCVYKFLDENNEVLYVGRTGNITGRIRSQHFSYNGHLPDKCYQQTTLVLYSKCLNEDDVKIKERYLVNKLKPKFNDHMNNGSDFNFIIDDFVWKYIPFDRNSAKEKRAKRQAKTLSARDGIKDLELIRK